MTLPDGHPANQYRHIIEPICETLGLPPLLLIALGDRESGWGFAKGYRPTGGPDGVGDDVPRPRKRMPQAQGLRVYFSVREKRLYPPEWPNGAVGFGLGLMQIDAEFHWVWATELLPGGQMQWMEPGANIARGAQMLRGLVDSFHGNPRAAIAAYNAGAGNVLAALRAGKDPDAPTTRGNYAQKVIERYVELGGQELSLV